MSGFVGPIRVKMAEAPVIGQGTVGTSAAQMPSAVINQGVTISADDDNTGDIYVGVEGVTSSNGYRIKAGKALYMGVENLDLLYVIGTAASQKYYYAGS